MEKYYKKQWEDALADVESEFKRLKAENARYREALEWYASVYLKNDEELDADIWEFEECYERGNIAREALKGKK